MNSKNAQSFIALVDSILQLRASAEKYLEIPEMLKNLLHEQYKKAKEAIDSAYISWINKLIDLDKSTSKDDLLPLLDSIEAFLEDTSEKSRVENARKAVEHAIALKLDIEADLDKIKFFDITKDNQGTVVGSRIFALDDVLKQNMCYRPVKQYFVEARKALNKIQDHLDDEEWKNYEKSFKNPRALKQMRQMQHMTSPKATEFHIGKSKVFDTYTMKCEVLNIIGLDLFYIRNLNLKDEEDAFFESMQNFYNYISLRKVKNPRVGFIAAAEIDGKWHRVKVISMDKRGGVKVFLLDAGRHENIKEDDLIMLHEKFFAQTQIAIKCCLADIAPLDGCSYPQRAVNEFKSIAQDLASMAENTVKIEFTKDLEQDSEEAGPCIVNICGIKDKSKIINFNAVVVAKKYAKSTGPASVGPLALADPEFERNFEAERRRQKEEEQMRAAQKDLQKKLRTPVTRIAVEFAENRQIRSPGEFNITIKCREKMMKELDEELQVSTDDRDTNTEFKVGDLCMVFRIWQPQAKGRWYRGIILEELQNDKYFIRLIDCGLEEIYTRSTMQDMAQKYAEIPHYCLKAHLASAVPAGFASFWSEASIDNFEALSKMYNSYAVSIVKEPDHYGNVAVNLFGVVKDGDVERHHDVLSYLCDVGLAFKNENDHDEKLVKPWNLKFYNESDVDASPNELVEEILEINQKRAMIEENKVYVDSYCSLINMIPKHIKEWPPAKKFEKGSHLFGKFHHVDKDGILYFQADYEQEFVAKMTRLISEYYGNGNPVASVGSTNEQLKPGDPVIARYYSDGKYYRAIVIRQSVRNPREYRLQYIDFGTFANTNISDIFTKVVGHSTPMQIHKFVLSGVVPVDGADHWTDDEIDLFFVALVDNNCLVEVIDDCPEEKDSDVKGVKIQVTQVEKKIADVAKHLIEHGIVRRRTSADKWPVELKRAEDPIKIKDEVEEGAAQNDDEECVQPNFTTVPVTEIKTFCSQSPLKTPFMSSVVNTSMNTYNTVKRAPRAVVSKSQLVKTTTFIDLRSTDHERFDCILIGIFDSSNFKLIIEPDIPEIQDAYDAMVKRLEETPPDYFKTFKHFNHAMGSACLVLCEEGNFVRGEVAGAVGSYARVDLVDSGKTKYCQLDVLRKMDMASLKCPRKILMIKLNVEKGQGAIGDVICEEILKKFGRQKLKAIVRSFDDEDFPVVDLVDENENLIYEEFITSGLLTIAEN